MKPINSVTAMKLLSTCAIEIDEFEIQSWNGPMEIHHPTLNRILYCCGAKWFIKEATE